MCRTLELQDSSAVQWEYLITYSQQIQSKTRWTCVILFFQVLMVQGSADTTVSPAGRNLWFIHQLMKQGFTDPTSPSSPSCIRVMLADLVFLKKTITWRENHYLYVRESHDSQTFSHPVMAQETKISSPVIHDRNIRFASYVVPSENSVKQRLNE